MHIDNNHISFRFCDAAFLKKFGLAEATQMVLDYRSQNDLPFIYDAYQLADFFAIKRSRLFELTKNTSQYYTAFQIKKKNGKARQLYAPSSPLKSCQSTINHRILSHLPVSEYATAYCKGSTISKNAAPHIGKRHLLKLDITDFFGSIRFDQVYSAAFNTRYFPVQIGTMLTQLCCLEDVLVQGAPTSPALSNIIMYNFDSNIGLWCKKHQIAYTRYCDDMTFSADTPLYPVYKRVKDMLEKMGMELNEQKTRFINSNNRQTVTGLTVNEKLSVSADYKRALRQEIYYALKYGLTDSMIHSGCTDFFLGGEPDAALYLRHLRGKVNFVLQVEPQNQWFLQAKEDLDPQNPKINWCFQEKTRR